MKDREDRIGSFKEAFMRLPRLLMSAYDTAPSRIAAAVVLVALLAAGEVRAADSIRLVLPPQPSPLVLKARELFMRQVSRRCGARIINSGPADFTLDLAVHPGIGREGFTIANDGGRGIRITGNDDRGLLYGIGKFLRTSSYGPAGFTPGSWRGTSVPKNEFRGIYFATHFHNFYHQAPVGDIQSYVEDLSLWGINTLAVWYDMHHFNGIDDPAAQAMLHRLRAILAAARSVGMKTNLMLVANEAYNNSPRELRAVGPGRGAFMAVELCPHKPGAKELLLKQFAQEFDAFAGVGVDYITLWPYDSGSCACDLCRPWGTNGFLYISEPLAQLARQHFPHVKIILSTWLFDPSEWTGLVQDFRPRPSWVDYIMMEPGTHESQAFLQEPVPGQLPMIGFPEISMAAMYPWGGFGANPQPARFQKEWDRVKDRFRGGTPYSEGIYEDLNKVIFSQFYWDPNRNALDTVREYLGYEFSPEVVPQMTKVVEILEQDQHYRWWPGAPGDYNFPGTKRWWNPAKGIAFKPDAHAAEAYGLVQQVQSRLPAWARNSWRWRIIYLRALLDNEFNQNGGRPTPRAEAAFRELVGIYHATDPDICVCLKPPLQ